MRILLTNKAKTDGVEVMEIIDVWHDNDLLDSEAHRRPKEKISGIMMQDMMGDYLYIPGVSQSDSNAICQKLLTDGFVNLTSFGAYEYV